MTIETSTKAFQDQINNHGAQITELIKHKTTDHKDYYTVHLATEKGTKHVFNDIGQILIFQCLQKSGQLEEFASSMFGSDLASFLRNGYQIKEYHLAADGESYSVTVHHVSASHILPNVSEEELAKCLAVVKDVVKMKNVFHLGFADANERGYSIVAYKKHPSNESFSVRVKKEETVKSYGNISRAHLAAALAVDEGSLAEEWGDQLQASNAAKRSSSNSPNRKMTLDDAMSLGAKLISSHPHETDANLFTAKVKTEDVTIHTFPTVTRKHLDAFSSTRRSSVTTTGEE